MNQQNDQDTGVKILFKNQLPMIPVWKRAIDVACCAAAFPLFCIITLVMAILLRLTSRGPILFQQERVGFKGRRFMCYKFRTMHVGADTKGHQAYLDSLIGAKDPTPMVKLDAKGDNRVIPFGWVLRSTGLDELPQIINIYRGQMSVVGPRPCIPYEYAKYDASERRRSNAVPGLTGLWQVSGKNRLSFDRMIELDIQYSETSSLWLDVKIILMTIPALFIQVADTRRARKAQARAGITRTTTVSSQTTSTRRPQTTASRTLI